MNAGFNVCSGYEHKIEIHRETTITWSCIYKCIKSVVKVVFLTTLYTISAIKQLVNAYDLPVDYNYVPKTSKKGVIYKKSNYLYIMLYLKQNHSVYKNVN